MRELFLLSDFGEQSTTFLSHFIKSSGADRSRIAFLMQGEKNWEKHFFDYKRIFSSKNTLDFFPIFPEKKLSFSEKMIDKLQQATGIFVGGGYMFRYIQAYTAEPLCSIIKRQYLAGIPYAGLSAGAILSNRLGILPQFAIKPHFNTKKRFSELLKKMKANRAKFGLGLDDGIFVEIYNEQEMKIFGKGSCYLFRNKGNDEYILKILHNGQDYSLIK